MNGATSQYINFSRYDQEMNLKNVPTDHDLCHSSVHSTVARANSGAVTVNIGPAVRDPATGPDSKRALERKSGKVRSHMKIECV